MCLYASTYTWLFQTKRVLVLGGLVLVLVCIRVLARVLVRVLVQVLARALVRVLVGVRVRGLVRVLVLVRVRIRL